MKSSDKRQLPKPEQFLVEAARLAARFSWPNRRLDHGDEVALVANMATDPDYERFIWSYDKRRESLRCLVVSRIKIPAKRRVAILELCSRINEGLPFGCAEYSFADDLVVFRDSADLGWGPFKQVLAATTQKVLNLATEYATTIHDTLDGEKPAEALDKVSH